MTAWEEARDGGAEAEWTILHDRNEANQLAAIARCELLNRQRRKSLIRYDFVAEPAWDMLLALYVSRHARQPIDVESLCLAAAAASTTALRSIGLLVEMKLIDWSHSGVGERDVDIALSDVQFQVPDIKPKELLGDLVKQIA